MRPGKLARVSETRRCALDAGASTMSRAGPDPAYLCWCSKGRSTIWRLANLLGARVTYTAVFEK